MQIPSHHGILPRRRRTASVISLPLPSSYQDEVLDEVLDNAVGNENASSLSRGPSLSRSRRPSVARSRSRMHSRSRPASAYSRYSDTELDYDDLSSAVSGTTLARALVSSYILSPSSYGSNSGQPYSRSRGHLARQDSATLPRGEFPFSFNRKSIRSSKSSTAGVSNHGSTYWSDRRISGDHIVLVSPEDRMRKGDDEVPPVPALPGGLSPEPSPYSSRSRKTSPNIESRRGSSAGLTAEWRRSSGPRRGTATEVVLDPVPDKKRRRISKISEASGSQASPHTLGASSSESATPDDDGLLSTNESDATSNHMDSMTRESTTENNTRRQDASGSSSHEPFTNSPSSDDTHGYDTPPLSHSLSTASTDSECYSPYLLEF